MDFNLTPKFNCCGKAGCYQEGKNFYEQKPADGLVITLVFNGHNYRNADQYTGILVYN
jgi:hypothetical protein